MSLIAKMPHFFFFNKNQHTCEEVNESRLITFFIWIIEAINGLIKKMVSFRPVNVQFTNTIDR